MNHTTIQHRLKDSFDKFHIRTAIEHGDLRLTYGDLEKEVNSITGQLLSRGIPKETFIGIFMEDRVSIISAMLGILNAGCVFVALDSAHPDRRLEQMIQVTNLPFVICDAYHLERLESMATVKQQSVAPLLLEKLQTPRQLSSQQPLSDVVFDPDDKIYIYFTSGTTGTPKAVLGRNKGLLHFVDWEISAFGVDETYRFSQFTTPGFDVFLRDIFVPLCAGAAICIPPGKEIILDQGHLTEWIDQKQINLMHIVPSLFRLIHAGNRLEKGLFKNLKYILLAGEKVIPGELKNWYQVIGDHVQLVNIYGPTETTLAKLFYLIRPSDIEREIMPVGKPIKGARVIILDEKMEICDDLAAGELYIRTPYRSFGYYNDPQLNKEKFIQNPFSQDPGDIIYKTGDLARALPDGNIELLGRIDRQVKIRGMRVELEEIESVLVKYPSVKEAVVIKSEIADNIILLLAGITFVENEKNRENEVVILEQIKAHLTDLLPDYMQPAQITLLQKIPRKPNGKVDFDELPGVLRYQKSEAAVPQNDIERRLLDTWTQILGNPPAGVTQSFFELGGNSLNLMTLISRIHREFDVRLSLGQAFNNVTIRKQAQIIEAAVEERFSPVEPVELREYYSLSPAQKRLYIIQQMDVTNTGYNLPRVVALGSHINREKLEQAFRQLIERHESLRTSFEMHGGEPIQRIHDDVTFTLENYMPLESFTSPFTRPFDLSRPPLLRAGVSETAGGKYLLLVDIHHIVSDGLSLDILEKDFMVLYAGEELLPLRLQYKDYSQWQNSEKERKVIKKQEHYWLEQFKDQVPVLHLPIDFKRPQVQDFSGRTINFQIGNEEIEVLKQMAIDRETTQFTIFLAIFTIFLAKITRQDDIVVGTASAGRRHADLEKIIGMFVNTLALRNYPEDEDTFTGFLTSVKQRSLEAFENQDYPFEDLVDRLVVNRDTSRNPLFDVMFAFNHLEDIQSRETSERENQKLIVHRNPFEDKTSKFDLTLTGTEAEKGLYFSLQYSTSLFKAESIERYITYFTRIVSVASSSPGRTIADIEIISPQEKQEILYDFNDPRGEFPGGKTIDQLFEEQVEKTPDRIAVNGHRQTRTGTENITYRQLNEQSNRLAGLLTEKGVQTDDIVGIMMERSLEMIIGIMGILKAGGAYLPLDTEFPGERIQYMLADSNAKILIGTEECRKKIIGNCQLLIVNCEFLLDLSQVPYQCSPFIVHHPDSLCYIIYTSGTTGKPKGVLTMHYNVIRVVRNTNYIDLRESDRLLQLSNYSFDGSVFDIYGALLNGAALVLIKKEEVFAADKLTQVIKDKAITVFFLTTALFNALVEIDPGYFKGVRKVLFGGERVSVEHCKKALQYAGKNKIIHVYGPTETTVYATFHPIEEIPGDPFTIPIGKPLSSTSAYILDKSFQPVPIGIPGDMYIGGDGTARGYLNNPELTTAKFSRHLWDRQDKQEEKNKSFFGGRGAVFSKKAPLLYHTGDLTLWLPGGSIQFLGRIDQQVKIRGFRVELAEIEKQLLKHEKIKEAIVIDRESDSRPKYLCAYIVSDYSFSVSQLTEYLSSHLPGYMIPSYFVQVEKIPLTANGKVDRKVLESYGTRIGTGVEYAEPTTDIEKIIADIWKEVLEVDKVGIHDNFFEIGGNSLKIIQVNTKLKEAFKKEIPVVTLFRYTTVGSIARSLEGRDNNELFTDYQHQVNEIAKGKQDRKQRLQKRRGDTYEQ